MVRELRQEWQRSDAPLAPSDHPEVECCNHGAREQPDGPGPAIWEQVSQSDAPEQGHGEVRRSGRCDEATRTVLPRQHEGPCGNGRLERIAARCQRVKR